MKTKQFVILTLCAATGISPGAFAQNNSRGGPDNHGPYAGHQQNARYVDNANHGGPDHRPAPDRQPPHADNDRFDDHGGPRGWHRGDHLPSDYRDHQYVVDNWHEHNLQAPPRGYRWVGINGDYVLAAVATGVIAQIVLSR
ncbi:RcnB family protein [Paraburkholderia strydomiana]|jgi:Ni/Co efflux regulator RcnB|uniref:RcnB family protein n=1 Tax=Paraburkholderia strydomiana TaxID=1245417 RepID=A0ABW9ER76_9BURK